MAVGVRHDAEVGNRLHEAADIIGVLLDRIEYCSTVIPAVTGLEHAGFADASAVIGAVRVHLGGDRAHQQRVAEPAAAGRGGCDTVGGVGRNRTDPLTDIAQLEAGGSSRADEGDTDVVEIFQLGTEVT